MKGRVRHNGRLVSVNWFNRYVRVEIKSRGPRRSHVIYAKFFLPALPWDDDKAETRIVNLNAFRDREWVDDMSNNYLKLGEAGLTTFFPDHP